MILIYAHNLSNRFKYTAELIFKSVLNIDYQLTDDKDFFKSSQVAKIAYTNETNLSSVYIDCDVLLFETHIKTEFPSPKKEYIDFPKFYVTDKKDFLGYDLFAMVFYFSVRYEEYLTTQVDNHQRFRAENSIAYQYNCLQIPFLNNATADFSRKLKNEFPQLEFKKRVFNFLSTIDIDNAFAYANKGLRRNLGGFVKDCFNLNFKNISSRILSNFDKKKDPYHTFDTINRLSEETDTQLKYFVLISDYSKYDKNPHHENKGFQFLLKSLSEKFQIGLHPSYHSMIKLEKISTEHDRLENILEKKITSARCHFLRIKLPNTYRAFIKKGITDDYTMIYASQCGFRTGLCMPYKWFDLIKNEQTNLKIHTSVMMEGTLRDYNKLNPEKALEISLNLLAEVKKHGGEFISIFHNDSFTHKNIEWINLYKSVLKESKK